MCIDELGLPDLSNTEKCYVTKDMATTHTCNSATGKVQLEARISKEMVLKIVLYSLLCHKINVF